MLHVGAIKKRKKSLGKKTRSSRHFVSGNFLGENMHFKIGLYVIIKKMNEKEQRIYCITFHQNQ